MNSLKQICNGILLEKGLPIHYFMTALISAIDALRELSMEEIAFINTKIVYPDSNGSIELPSGLCDFVNISVPVGQVTQSLVPDKNINSLPNYSLGAIVPYSTTESPIVYGGFYQYSRCFNDTYKLLREQNRIQLNENLIGTEQCILEYITDGMDVDSATRVHPHAYQAIKVYVEWKMDRNPNGGKMFGIERKKIRARRNDITPEALKRLIERNAAVR